MLSYHVYEGQNWKVERAIQTLKLPGITFPANPSHTLYKGIRMWYA